MSSTNILKDYDEYYISIITFLQQHQQAAGVA